MKLKAEVPQTLTLRAYNPEPTAKQFHASPALFRGIMGPFGSGKSVACALEAFSRSLEQTPNPQGVRATRWAFIRNCFDDRTEVLTECRGWQKFKDLQAEDRVASLQDSQTLVWEKPTLHYAAPWKGELLGFRNEGIDFLVTPTHKLHVSKTETRKKVWSKFRLMKACEVARNAVGYRVKRDVAPQTGTTCFSEKFFEWVGFWFAEGSTADRVPGRTPTLLVSQGDPRGVEYFRGLCRDAGIPMTESGRVGKKTFRLPVTPAFQYLTLLLSSCGKSLTKAIPQWVKEAPAGHLRAFIHGYIAGDGWLGQPGTRFACTSSRQLASDLQELAFRAGYVANLSVRDRIGRRSSIGAVPSVPEWIITFVCPAKFTPALSVGGYAKKYPGWYRQDYDGMVYCVEVSSHVIYVRRNGVAHWSSQSYPELLSTTAKTWQEWVPENICPLSIGVNVSARLTQRLGDNTWVDMEIFFLALERDDDIRKLKSLELTGAWLNEASELKKSVLDMAMSRVGRYPAMIDGGASWSGIIADTNPVSDDHWWYKLAEVSKPKGYVFFKQPPAVVPVYKEDKNFPPEYVANDGTHGFPPAENVIHHKLGYDYWLRQVAGKDQEWIKVFLMGQYGTVMMGKCVYPEYNDSMHCSPKLLEPYRGLPLLIGWDFGLNASCVLTQLSPQGQLLVLDELTSEDMGIQRFARERVKPLLNNKYDGMSYMSVGDPAGSQRSQTTEATCLQILAEEGFPCISAPTNEFVARREAVAWFLSKMVGGHPAFFLSPSCDVLRKGFLGKYFYRKVHISKTDRFLERPEKNEFSHCLAGGTQVHTAAGVKPIESVLCGDRVLTPQGNRAVCYSGKVGTRYVYRVLLSTGVCFRATAEHKIATMGGWKRVDTLQSSDVLYCIKEEKEILCQGPQYIRCKSSMENDITKNPRDIIAPIRGRLESGIYTGLFGLRNGGRFRSGIASIMSTAIGRIAELRTSILSRRGYMPTTTFRSGCENILGALRKCLRLLWRKPQSGMDLPPDLSGTASTVKRLGWDGLWKNIIVFCAGKPTACCWAGAKKGIVLPHVSLRLGVDPELITSTALAQYAKQFSGPTGTPRGITVANVVSILPEGVTDVYDLTVETEHCFFADGVLVSNCHDALQYACLQCRVGNSGADMRAFGGGALARPVKRSSMGGWT